MAGVFNITIIDMQKAQMEIKKALAKIASDMFVTVGIHEDAGAHDGTDMTNAKLGAILHFGAKINHPGGTSYGFASQDDFEKNRISFLKKGSGILELGVTGPHVINIPARPWLDVGVAKGNQEYLSTVADAVKNGQDMKQALEKVGVIAVGHVQKYMTELRTPPNAASTIAKKGSDNPLIDNGQLRQSVTSKVQNDKPDEGIE